MTVVEWCVSEANDLRFIGREFHKRGEELRNEYGGNRWKGKTQMIIGTGSAGRFDIYEPVKVISRRLCVTEMILY